MYIPFSELTPGNCIKEIYKCQRISGASSGEDFVIRVLKDTRFVAFILCGGGGGGAGGSTAALGSAAIGGGGGGTGSCSMAWFATKLLPDRLHLVGGAGGAGGAAAGNGSSGKGVFLKVYTDNEQAEVGVTVLAALGGTGGTTAAGGNGFPGLGASTLVYQFLPIMVPSTGGSSGSAPSSGNPGANVSLERTNTAHPFCVGGTAGGGTNASNVGQTSGAYTGASLLTAPFATTATAAGANGVLGIDFVETPHFPIFNLGGMGGGGNTVASGAGGAGGHGGAGCGGGGGGGCNGASAVAGIGGNGGDGFLIAYYF